MAWYPTFSAPAGVLSLSKTLLLWHGNDSHCMANAALGMLYQHLQACWLWQGLAWRHAKHWTEQAQVFSLQG